MAGMCSLTCKLGKRISNISHPFTHKAFKGAGQRFSSFLKQIRAFFILLVLLPLKKYKLIPHLEQKKTSYTLCHK